MGEGGGGGGMGDGERNNVGRHSGMRRDGAGPESMVPQADWRNGFRVWLFEPSRNDGRPVTRFFS